MPVFWAREESAREPSLGLAAAASSDLKCTGRMSAQQAVWISAAAFAEAIMVCLTQARKYFAVSMFTSDDEPHLVVHEHAFKLGAGAGKPIRQEVLASSNVLGQVDCPIGSWRGSIHLRGLSVLLILPHQG